MNRPMHFTPSAFLRPFFALLLALYALGFARNAQASSTILVLSVGDESTKTLLQANAEAALRDAGIQVTQIDDALLAGFDPQYTISCLDNDEVCDALLKKAPAEWVLLLRLRVSDEGPDADRTVIAQLYSTADGALLQVEQRVCKRCSSNERLLREITDLVQAIASDEVANKASETYLDVSSTPPHAILRIDGVVVGQTGQPYRVTPGEHSIELEHEGYRVASQRLTVLPDEHKALSVTLSRDAAEDGGGTLRSILTYGSLGIGAGAMIAGVSFLVIDGDSSSDGSRDRVQDTKTLGIGSLAAGAALVGVGVALLLTDSDDDDDDIQVSAVPTAQGMAFGLSGRF